MDTFVKKIKNSDGSFDKVLFSSNDNYWVNIGNNYKLVKFYNEKKSIKNSLIGTDIGINSSGFISVILTAGLIALISFIGIILSFRI